MELLVLAVRLTETKLQLLLLRLDFLQLTQLSQTGLCQTALTLCVAALFWSQTSLRHIQIALAWGRLGAAGTGQRQTALGSKLLQLGQAYQGHYVVLPAEQILTWPKKKQML